MWAGQVLPSFNRRASWSCKRSWALSTDDTASKVLLAVPLWWIRTSAQVRAWAFKHHCHLIQMLTEDVPILPWKHKKCAPVMSLWNSSKLPSPSNKDQNKLRRVQIKHMFSVDGRNVKRILINEFINGSSHFAGCLAISANQFWTLATTFICFSKSHFQSDWS